MIISNCVINLSADKAAVLREAFRVLKPGGRFAVSDVVRQGQAPESILRSMEAWIGCIAGALHQRVYTTLLAEAGFTDIGIEVTRSYSTADLTDDAGCCVEGVAEGDLPQAAGLFVSAFIRADQAD